MQYNYIKNVIIVIVRPILLILIDFHVTKHSLVNEYFIDVQEVVLCA